MVVSAYLLPCTEKALSVSVKRFTCKFWFDSCDCIYSFLTSTANVTVVQNLQAG